MPNISKYEPGQFCWADLGTSDVPASKKFYKGIFGCAYKDLPMPGMNTKYWMMKIKGRDAGAIYSMAEALQKMNAPPMWMPFISVKNADLTLKKAAAAGAKPCTGVMDIMKDGRCAVMIDPTGAGFAIWQPLRHKGAGIAKVQGSFCWHDLNTPDTKAAAEFYRTVFKWKVVDKQFGQHGYHIFKMGKKEVCGMWPTMMRGTPPCWITHWQVNDCAKTVAKAKKLGGKILMDTFTVPNGPTCAVIADPQGGVLGLVQFPEKI